MIAGPARRVNRGRAPGARGCGARVSRSPHSGLRRPALVILRRVAAGAAVACLMALAGGAIIARSGDAPDGPPPVVMIVFDEFPTTSLLDAHGRIDAVRYPNFARLARDANWFPQA